MLIPNPDHLNQKLLGEGGGQALQVILMHIKLENLSSRLNILTISLLGLQSVKTIKRAQKNPVMWLFFVNQKLFPRGGKKKQQP